MGGGGTSSLFQHPQLPGRASEGWGDPPFGEPLFIKGSQSDLFLEPPTARGKLRSHTIERSDARICYRTAQPRFRWCKRRRTALRSPETSSSAERKSWDFHRKVGFEWMTDRGQNASGGPASTHEILIPCAGLPAPPLQHITRSKNCSGAEVDPGRRGGGGGPLPGRRVRACPVRA